MNIIKPLSLAITIATAACGGAPSVQDKIRTGTEESCLTALKALTSSAKSIHVTSKELTITCTSNPQGNDCAIDTLKIFELQLNRLGITQDVSIACDGVNTKETLIAAEIRAQNQEIDMMNNQ